MECSPTDASEETIEMYNVPIHGEFANDLSKLNMFRMIIYMFFMLMLLFLAVMIVPTLYKQFVINYLVRNFIIEETKQPKFLMVIDYIFVVLMFLLSIMVTRYGMEEQKHAQTIKDKSKETKADNITVIGFMIFIFTIFSIFIIQIFKQNSSLEYNLSVQKVSFEMGILLTIFYSILGLLWKFKGFLAVIFIFIFIVFIMYYSFTLESSDPKFNETLLGSWPAVLIISILITLFYNAGDDSVDE